MFHIFLLFFRLYKSIGDFDVLQGIFSGKLNTKELTKRALEAEARCDYQAARKLYQEVTTNTSFLEISWQIRVGNIPGIYKKIFTNNLSCK